MRKLNLRKLIGLTGMAVLFGAMVFVAYGGVIDGTDRADTLVTDSNGDVVYGRGGSDNIDSTDEAVQLFAGPGDDSVIYAETSSSQSDGSSVILGETGDDSIKLQANSEPVRAEGNRGSDFFNVTGNLPANSDLVDGPGQDTVIDSGGGNKYTVTLVNDNTPDTVQLDNFDGTVRLGRGSGRDVIDCGGGNGTVVLNGNRKATDMKGNNLRKAALIGGTAQSNCGTIIP